MGLIPPTSRLRLLAVFAASATVATAVITGWGTPPEWAVPALAAAVLLTELAEVRLSFGRHRWTFSMTEAAVAAAFVHSAHSWTVLAVFAGTFVAQLIRRQPALQLSFTVSQLSAATALGAGVTVLAGGGIAAVLAGMATFWCVNNLLQGAGVTALTGQSLRGVLWASAPFAAIHSAGAIGSGVLGSWLAVHAPLGLFALFVPLLLLWMSYDEQRSRRAEASLYAELARLQGSSGERSVDSSANVVLTAAARLLEGDEVELVLLAHEGPVRYTGDASGVHRHRADPAAFDEPLVLRALEECAVVTGVDEDRPWCAVALGGRETPLAVLVVRRAAGAAGFTRRETMLARVLGQQAESWLSIVEIAAARDEALAQAEAAEDTARALGDIGADAAPALRVLRDSANRLAALATSDGPTAVGEIVDELYAVERAVASLLGAIALAAEPELARNISAEDVRLAGTHRFDDWTTTGVLTS